MTLGREKKDAESRCSTLCTSGILEFGGIDNLTEKSNGWDCTKICPVFALTWSPNAWMEFVHFFLYTTIFCGSHRFHREQPQWPQSWQVFFIKFQIKVNYSWEQLGFNVSATPIGQMGLEMGWFPLGNGVCLIMKKAPSDSPIWQLKKRELLLPLSFLITKPLKLDLSNLHYGPHYKPHYRTQGCVIRENNITTPLGTPLRTPLRIL